MADEMADEMGVPNGRTALALKRTALSLLAGAEIISRLTVESNVPVGWL